MIRFLFVIIAIIMIVAIGFVLFGNRSNQTSQKEGVATANCTKASATRTATITFGGDGSPVPNCILIDAGTTLTWKNESQNTVEVGANPHPEHTGNKELSNNQYKLDLNPGQSSTVTLMTKGSFGFHNHLQPNTTGTIIVQ